MRVDNLETLKKKVDMLEALQDIEIATSLLQGDSASGSALDDCYKKLNTAMSPLDKSSDEYKVIFISFSLAANSWLLT